MQALRKYPYTKVAHFFTLPKEIQEVIAMNFYNQHGTNAWDLKFDGLRETIKLEENNMWMEFESLTNWIHLFH